MRSTLVLFIFMLHCVYSYSSTGVALEVSSEEALVPEYSKRLKLLRKQHDLRDNRQSRFDWKKIDPYDWFNIHRWVEHQEKKDKVENWRLIYQDAKRREFTGRMIQCIGRCLNYRDKDSIRVGYLSEIMEGDEIVTEKDSYAWIMLVDGTLIRMSPSTSISLNEFNLSDKKTIFTMRLAQGHVRVESRRKGQFNLLNQAETDLAFYPLGLNQANRELFAINEFNLLETDYEKNLYFLAKNKGHITQYKKLNKLTNEKMDFNSRDHEFIIYTPNLTLKGKNGVLNLKYKVNGKSLFHFSDKAVNFSLDENDKRQAALLAQRRGYVQDELIKIDPQTWYSSSPNGREIQPENDPKAYYHLNIARGFTKRIPTIHLARELMVRKYSLMLFSKKLDPKDLLLHFGYRLWNVDKKDELALREKFTFEYVRRLETTNLRVMNKLLPEGMDFGRSDYMVAMNLYYEKLKEIYSNKLNEIVKFSMMIITYGL